MSNEPAQDVDPPAASTTSLHPEEREMWERLQRQGIKKRDKSVDAPHPQK